VRTHELAGDSSKPAANNTDAELRYRDDAPLTAGTQAPLRGIHWRNKRFCS